MLNRVAQMPEWLTASPGTPHLSQREIYAVIERMKRLRAWERQSFDGLILRVRYRNDTYSTGRADARSLAITAGTDPADVHATVLHELTHVTLRRRRFQAAHGRRWRQLYLAAASEVARRPLCLEAEETRIRQVDLKVRDVMHEVIGRSAQ